MNYKANVFTPTGVRVPMVLCLHHLVAKRNDIVGKPTSRDTRPCDVCAHLHNSQENA